jgi:two-component system, chemotaxis family, sensor kinase CheA
MTQPDEMVKEFLTESYENLEQLDRDLVALETNPQDHERLQSIFRTIHTIKGTCGFFAFAKLESVTHVGESLLSQLRDGQLRLRPEITTALLALVDAIREMLARIEKTGQEGNSDYEPLIQTLTRLQEGASLAQPRRPVEEVAKDHATLSSAGPKLADGKTPATQAKVPAKQAPTTPKRLGEMLVEEGVIKREDLERALVQQAAGDKRFLGEIIIEQGSAQPGVVLQTLLSQHEARTAAVSDATVRVDVGLLDKLMNLVGELVLARNQILQFTANHKDAAFLSSSQRLNLITTELQAGVMQTRMQPIGNIWDRFPRVVRDLAVACGKQVRIEMEGKETELDKTIIEAIKDPLTHVVRNAVDHGIEKPDLRQANGKQPEGRIFLRAFHEGGQVNMEISDDGAGICADRVKQKALQRGLIAPEQAARMNQRDLVNLIFLPGFSTAEQITKVSGRGVGMDVVKTNIERIGGTVDIHSQPGTGTTLKFKIPLTLAIIPALIVTNAGQRYAIPQVNLVELVRLQGEQAHKGIENINGTPVYRLRDRLLPLVSLTRVLAPELQLGPNAVDEVTLVVLRTDNCQFGLIVDRINDAAEIVVKPLGKLLKGIDVFAGATIMGDGRVALILDVLGIAKRSGAVGAGHDHSTAVKHNQANERNKDGQSCLLFALGKNRRLAMPLSLVARLEKVSTDRLEKANKREVIQYRGRILPLVRLADLLFCEDTDTCTGKDSLQMVVHTQNGRSVGLVVGKILDIVETTLNEEQAAKRDGLVGSAVIHGRVTDLLDLPTIMGMVDPLFYGPAVAV